MRSEGRRAQKWGSSHVLWKMGVRVVEAGQGGFRSRIAEGRTGPDL